MNLNVKDYARAFQFKMHPPFLIVDLFAKGYRNVDHVMISQDGWFTTYISKESIKQTSKIGIEIYSNKSNFQKLIDESNTYEKGSEEYFKYLLTKKSLNLDETKRFFDVIVEFWTHFQKTEFIYLDSAFEFSKNDAITAENLKSFGEFKYHARGYMNLVLYSGPKYFESVLRILSEQFKIDYETISNYSQKEIIDLYSQKITGKDKIQSIKNSYSIIYLNQKDSFLFGIDSRSFVSAFISNFESGIELKGRTACKGKVRGKVRIIIIDGFDKFNDLLIQIEKMKKGEILVTETTTPEFTPACSKATAILTAQGGMMSHAAIISRELKIPCIVGIHNILKVLKTGDMVEVDAEKGIVRKI
ncbi:MAG: PEP-utilizing enzyme [Patescibacteria group bacterium]